MKSIVKLDRNGLVDTSFGGFGSVRWRRFNGQGILNDLILYDDTTLVVLDEEYSQESPPLESEYAIRYFDTRTGEDRGVAYIPFEYVADPQLWLHRLVVDANGTLYAGGGFLERRDTAKTYPTIYSFVNRTEPNRAFYDTAQYSLPRSYDCFITDMRLNSRGQLILYAWYDNLVLIGEPMTSVPPTIELPSLSVSPNPCVDRVVLRASFPCADLRYELISMLGVVVQSGIIEQDGSLEFSPAVIKGAYGLRLQTRDQLVRSAIIYVTRHD
ncbi:MAG: hypothetical protein JSS89_01540 [Bacteroidetes bacterium]|nr:hypothetical protein [Bacteroidota bacterium]